jgi:hypothetical protein
MWSDQLPVSATLYHILYRKSLLNEMGQVKVAKGERVSRERKE